jgi:hypothetical protein
MTWWELDGDRDSAVTEAGILRLDCPKLLPPRLASGRATPGSGATARWAP